MFFKINYGLGGGYNTNDVEFIECESEDTAQKYAFDLACQEYESCSEFDYDAASDELTDNGFKADTAEFDAAIWDLECEDRERWVSHCAKEITLEEYLTEMAKLESKNKQIAYTAAIHRFNNPTQLELF